MFVELKLKEKDYIEIQTFFKKWPKEVQKRLKTGWKKIGKRIVKAMKSQGYKKRGSESVGRGPGRRWDKASHSWIRRKHLAQALQTKVDFMGKERVGGFIRLSYGRVSSDSPKYIGRFQEFGTKRIRARAPMQHSFINAQGEFMLIKETEKTLNKLVREFK